MSTVLDRQAKEQKQKDLAGLLCNHLTRIKSLRGTSREIANDVANYMEIAGHNDNYMFPRSKAQFLPVFLEDLERSIEVLLSKR